MQRKVVFVGDSGVGKTSIIKQQTEHRFTIQMECTIGMDHDSLDIDTLGEKVQLLIWDTAGQEKFSSLVPYYLRNACVACFVCSAIDETSMASFQVRWLPLLQSTDASLVTIAVVNKTDLMQETSISRDEIMNRLAGDFVSVHFVSAKWNNGIDALFLDVATRAVETRDEIPLDRINCPTNNVKPCC
jgi:Ras-related protein Rab-6A